MDTGALALATGVALAAGDAAVGGAAFPMLPEALATPAWVLLFLLLGGAGWLVWRREGLGGGVLLLGGLAALFALRPALGAGHGVVALVLGLLTGLAAHLLARRGQRGPAALLIPLAIAVGALAFV